MYHYKVNATFAAKWQLVTLIMEEFLAFLVALSSDAVFSRLYWTTAWRNKSVASMWKLEHSVSIVGFKSVWKLGWIRKWFNYRKRKNLKVKVRLQDHPEDNLTVLIQWSKPKKSSIMHYIFSIGLKPNPDPSWTFPHWSAKGPPHLWHSPMQSSISSKIWLKSRPALVNLLSTLLQSLMYSWIWQFNLHQNQQMNGYPLESNVIWKRWSSLQQTWTFSKGKYKIQNLSFVDNFRFTGLLKEINSCFSCQTPKCFNC